MNIKPKGLIYDSLRRIANISEWKCPALSFSISPLPTIISTYAALFFVSLYKRQFTKMLWSYNGKPNAPLKCPSASDILWGFLPFWLAQWARWRLEQIPDLAEGAGQIMQPRLKEHGWVGGSTPIIIGQLPTERQVFESLVIRWACRYIQTFSVFSFESFSRHIYNWLFKLLPIKRYRKQVSDYTPDYTCYNIPLAVYIPFILT